MLVLVVVVVFRLFELPQDIYPTQRDIDHWILKRYSIVYCNILDPKKNTSGTRQVIIEFSTVYIYIWIKHAYHVSIYCIFCVCCMYSFEDFKKKVSRNPFRTSLASFHDPKKVTFWQIPTTWKNRAGSPHLWWTCGPPLLKRIVGFCGSHISYPIISCIYKHMNTTIYCMIKKDIYAIHDTL